MQDTLLTAQDIRTLLLSALPEQTSSHGQTPEVRQIYLPPTHARALHPDISLVLGIRGAGKSFWWAALQNEENRNLLGEEIAELRNAIIAPGFGERPRIEDYPNPDTLDRLLENGADPKIIWKTVAINALQKTLHPTTGSFFDFHNLEWERKVEAIQTSPEQAARTLEDCDSHLESENRVWLLLFDALDRSASNWERMDRLIRGLLQQALEMRTFRRLRFKCFLRVDQIESRNVTNFPDASKLLAEKIELLWRPRDLYNLLWHHLLNLPENGQGAAFFSQNGYRVPVPPDSSTPISVPDSLKRSEEEQRKLFHTITGPWMGRDRRRGFPYTWIINHLGDAKGQVSPRSFLAALREAAADTRENYPDHDYALHYSSIKRGVQKASTIRVKELAEDYPWIEDLMRPLEGLVVPVEFEEIKHRWNQERTLEGLTAYVRLPPEHLEEGAGGVRKDLEQIGIFQRMKDGRVNIPDLYRVGFKMGRRGGVRPVGRN